MTRSHDGLMAAKTAEDFVWTDGRGACGRTLVSKSAAEKMRMLPRAQAQSVPPSPSTCNEPQSLHANLEPVTTTSSSDCIDRAATEQATPEVQGGILANQGSEHNEISVAKACLISDPVNQTVPTVTRVVTEEPVPQPGGSSSAAAAELAATRTRTKLHVRSLHSPVTKHARANAPRGVAATDVPAG
ncbi:hypothetical protein EXIGLDRAFT_240655 [Exidia glandulosa HHB12029]|uniref:Uncharacterized protein n=1 Tax=Exidia glandulosa HHB12029 TaxID=1314781 RepID=A0A165Q6J0_EXIGL|nr:hypothetical protein EXIGLDRAFT_240655 [Exidia glandulosa HHB12029]